MQGTCARWYNARHRKRGHLFQGRYRAAVADVTGDHKNNLIVLMHDRVLVYAQE
jgi:hypothetical protein